MNKLTIICILLVSLCCVESSKKGTRLVNYFADKLIERLSNHLKESKVCVLMLSDIEYFKESMFGNKSVVTSEGTFSDVCTLHRNADVSYKVDGKTFRIHLSVALKTARFHFGYFRFIVGGVELGDEMDIVTNNNNIELQLTFDAAFKVTLDCALISFSKFSVERRKQGKLRSNLKDGMFHFILHMYRESMRKSLEFKLQTKLQEGLNKTVSDCNNVFLRFVLKLVLRGNNIKNKTLNNNNKN